MRRPFVAGNWKMNGTDAQARALAGSLVTRLTALLPRVDIAVAPPFTSLRTVGESLSGTGIALAAQSLHSAPHGAFTGEISAGMLVALDVRFVIVGHSERRRLFGESDAEVGRKAAAARESGLVPILCVGEEESDRLAGRTLEVIERQVRAGIEKIEASGSTLVVAYEPVWAIGTGRTASPAQASEAHLALRATLRSAAGDRAADDVRILYGGSVTAENAAAMLQAPGVDGALVGGASLDPESFVRIAAAAVLRT